MTERIIKHRRAAGPGWTQLAPLAQLIILGWLVVISTGFNQAHYLTHDPDAPQQNSEEPVLINPRIYPAIFYSSAPLTITFDDGRSYTLGESRMLIELKSGWNHFQLSGPGIFPQQHKLYHYKRVFAPKFYIAPRPWSGATTSSPQPSGATTTRSPRHFASSCHKLKASTTRHGLTQIDCPYSSLDEELKMVGPFPVPLPADTTSNSKQTYNSFFDQLLSFRPPFMLQLMAENLHRTTPQSTSGYEAAGLSSLIAGDCHRIHGLAGELKQLGLASIPMRTYQAICYELAEEPMRAAEHYNQLLTQLKANDPTSAPALYQRARWQARTSLLSAEQTLLQCTRNHPWFFPCFQRLADIAVAKGQFSRRGQLINQFTTYADGTLVGEVTATIELIQAGELDAARSRLAAHPLKDIAFSLIWLSMSLNRPHHKTTIRTPKAYQGRMLSEPAARLVLEHLMTTRAQDFLALEVALHIMARDSHAYAKDHQTALLTYLYEHNRCAKAIHINFPHAARPQYLSTATDEDIMDVQSMCYLRLKHYKKAETLIFKMQHQFPSSWRPIFRLAELYIAQGQTSKGLNTFRLTQSYLPPAAIVEEIKLRIKAIQELEDSSSFGASL